MGCKKEMEEQSIRGFTFTKIQWSGEELKKKISK